MDPDGDDLEIIGLTSESPPPQPRRGRRGARRTIALTVAGALLLGAAIAGAGRLRDRPHGSRSSETIVLPAATASPSSTTATSNPLLPGPDAEFVEQMRLISPGVGWALNGLALQRTLDDGAHWSTITPPPGPDGPIGSIYAIDFLDADHAWAALTLTSSRLMIFRTIDGGRSWTPMVPNLCGTVSVQHPAPCGSPVSISFVDPDHGWALFSKPRSRGTLLGTNDGGRTWKLVGRTPFSGALHFVDPNDGWAVNDPSHFIGEQPSAPGGALYRTTDGGRTWAVVALPTGEAIGSLPLAVGAPQILGRDELVVARIVLIPGPSHARSIVVYTSHDGGTTWTTHDAPSSIRVRFTESGNYRFSAATASDWALLTGPRLFVTHDAGGHWRTLEPLQGRFGDVDFTTPSRGWLIANNLLYRTTDGGASWLPNSPAIGLTANRLP